MDLQFHLEVFELKMILSFTVHVFKIDAALRKSFPLLHRDCATNIGLECVNTPTEVLNVALEDTNTADEKP